MALACLAVAVLAAIAWRRRRGIPISEAELDRRLEALRQADGCETEEERLRRQQSLERILARERPEPPPEESERS
jgi:hypothetical protein